jgi:hypothetical protein
MSEHLISQLNQRIASTIAKQKPLNGNGAGAASKFDQILTQKQNTGFEKLVDAMSNGSDSMKAMPANDIQINIGNSEVETSFAGGDAKQGAFGMFSKINSDMLKMDSMVDVLSSGNVRMGRKELLAYQIAANGFSLSTDLYTKMAQMVSTNLNTLFQMNLG